MKKQLDPLSEKITKRLEGLSQARDVVLKTQREVIRCASLSIRAVHRGEFENARSILQEADNLFAGVREKLETYPELYYSGYIHDAQKEFAEAHITYALVKGEPLPDPDALKIEYAAYLNGIGEAIGEMRRYILDKIRRDDFHNGETVLDAMDDLYCMLTAMDFPDAITRGLRRTTDVARSIIEKTRGDLTQNLCQKKLSRQLESLSCAKNESF